MMLITPPVASEPYWDAPGPLITSILSMASIFVTSSILTPVDLDPLSELSPKRPDVILSTRRPSTSTTTRESPLMDTPLL